MTAGQTGAQNVPRKFKFSGEYAVSENMLTIRVKQQCSCGRCEAWAVGDESIHVQADNRADALRQIADKL